jgi:hypothetical protein
MREWMIPLVVLVAYVVLMRWVLPMLGVPTCMSGACGFDPQRKKRD